MRKYCYSLLFSMIAVAGCLALFVKVCSSNALKRSSLAGCTETVPPDSGPLAENAAPETSTQIDELEMVTETSPERSRSSSTSISRDPGAEERWEVAPSDGQSIDSPSRASGDAETADALDGNSPAGDLAISGRILNSQGQPLEGIRLTARPYDPAAAAAPDGSPAGEAESAAGGAFEIAGLLQGEYVVSTAPTRLFTPTTRILRAGESAADFVLHEMEEVVSSGLVVDERGEPLPEVEIIPDDQASRRALSNPEGLFRAVFRWSPELPLHTLRFSKEGYREELVRWNEAEFKKGAEDLRVVLRNVGDRISIQGILHASDGAGIAGETITLYSSQFNASYKAVSGERGLFRIAAVQAGSEYRIRVYPEGNFQDHEEYTFIDEDSSPLRIVLKPLGAGALQGVAQDRLGVPLPDFTFWVQSAKAGHKSLQVITGPDGRFELESVPEGPLVFETRSWPKLSVRGFQMPASGKSQVTLILDWGNRELKGHIIDPSGQPIPGAQVQLTWTHKSIDLLSTSQRTTLSDDAGLYRFSCLGPGLHKLSASLPERPEASQSVEADPGSGDVDMVMKEKSRDP